MNRLWTQSDTVLTRAIMEYIAERVRSRTGLDTKDCERPDAPIASHLDISGVFHGQDVRFCVRVLLRDGQAALQYYNRGEWDLVSMRNCRYELAHPDSLDRMADKVIWWLRERVGGQPGVAAVNVLCAITHGLRDELNEGLVGTGFTAFLVDEFCTGSGLEPAGRNCGVVHVIAIGDRRHQQTGYTPVVLNIGLDDEEVRVHVGHGPPRRFSYEYPRFVGDLVRLVVGEVEGRLAGRRS